MKQNVTEENANRDTAIKKLLLKMENCEEYNAERTIPTPSHLKSSVWKHFGFYTVGGKVTNKDEAVCLLCKRELSYLSTTSNLRTYLLAYHRNVAAEEQLPSGAAQSVQPRVTAFYSAHSAGPLPDARNKGVLLLCLQMCYQRCVFILCCYEFSRYT